MSQRLYPKISPYTSTWVQVDDTHQLYVEETGNKNGIPVIGLHGGPGAGCSENYRRYFDPEKYRIILFDQRGCGRSTPSPSTLDNTSWNLIDDIEKIRTYLGIEKWLVTGGSWGTTLAIAYGLSHSKHILGFILRGIFLGTEAEYDWLYKADGAAKFFPEYYQEFLSILSEEQRLNPLQGYQQILTSDNELAVAAASQAWFLWELRLSTIEHHPVNKSDIDDKHQALCMAKISAHFFTHRCHFSSNYLLEKIDRIAHIPAIILHGRYDMVCQLDIAYQLSQKWPNAQLQILPYAGHSGFETQTIDAFCKAANTMARFLAE